MSNNFRAVQGRASELPIKETLALFGFPDKAEPVPDPREEAETLFARVNSMTHQEALERVVFLEGLVEGLTGKPAPETSRD